MRRNETVKNVVPSVNLFLTSACNMRCKFCFAPPHNGRLSCPRDVRRIIQECRNIGIDKITFVGGEPLLYPGLFEVVSFAHSLGLTTCVVTNASLLNQQWIEQFSPVLDWLGMSVDSLFAENNIYSGRSVDGNAISSDHYLAMAKAVKLSGMRLKINTTVTSWTKKDDLSSFIKQTLPDRWKIFQALNIAGVNSGTEDFSISSAEFHQYVEKLHGITEYTDMVAESASDMTESYLMIAPDGRFFDNVGNRYNYSPPIVDVGIHAALDAVRVDGERFARRGGVYDWSR